MGLQFDRDRILQDASSLEVHLQPATYLFMNLCRSARNEMLNMLGETPGAGPLCASERATLLLPIQLEMMP